jgi:hypothetical protein
VARIRTIKPEFFTSEDIVGLSPLARLLYIALWCEADREGRMTWKPKTFKMRYLPADDCDIEVLCQELVAAGVVKLYGVGLAYVPGFGKHQHINPRETPSSLPDPDASRTRQPRVSTRAATASDAQGGREGKEGDGRVCDDAPRDPAPLPVAKIPLVDGSEHEVFASQVAEWSAAFPGVDIPVALAQMRTWCIANPSRKKTRRGVEAFIVGWLSKDQNKGTNRAARPMQVGFEGAI